MITNAHKINQEFTDPSIKASIFILFTIFSNKEIINDQRFIVHKENAQKIVSQAMEKNLDSTNQLIKSLGLEPKTVSGYLKNRMAKTNKKGSNWGCVWLILAAIVFFIIAAIASA